MSPLLEKQTRRSLPPLAKVGLCAVLIAAIGLAIGILGTDGTVNESHADIAWLGSFERSNTDRMLTALDRLGHEEPARFNLNGNTIFFSDHTSRKTPRELMLEYQEEFRRQGLNDRVYHSMKSDEEDARNFTGLTGGLVPIAVSDNQVILAGVVTANRAKDSQGLIENVQNAQDYDKLFRGHRYIEMTRSHDSRHTSIVASFSDEAFEYERMTPGSTAAGQVYDEVVPPCPGCTRLTRFADDNPRTAERVDIAFIGPRTLDETRSFYVQTLFQQGWRPLGIDTSLREMEAHFEIPRPTGEALILSRGSKELTLAFLPDFETGETITFGTYTGR